MNITQDKTDLTDKTPLLVAERVLASAAASYEQALADQQRDIAHAAATKGHLGDGYWQLARMARLRLLAAHAIMEAVNEG